MKPGKSPATGHVVELRPKPGSAVTKRQGEQPTYFYCTDCRQYAWAWQPICPVNSKLVTITERVAI